MNTLLRKLLFKSRTAILSINRANKITNLVKVCRRENMSANVETVIETGNRRITIN